MQISVLYLYLSVTSILTAFSQRFYTKRFPSSLKTWASLANYSVQTNTLGLLQDSRRDLQIWHMGSGKDRN